MSDIQYYFHNFIEKLAINETELGTQITKWKECLEKDISIDFVRKSGSTKRGTDLKFSDVDLIVLYNCGRTDTSVPPPFLAIAENEIGKCFGKIHQMDHGFVYKGLSNITIDIVTGYVDEKNPLVFWIPDKRNDEFVWIETSPDASEERIKDANRLTSGNAGKYVRLMKYWNIKNNKCFNSFHLETLVIKNVLTDSERFNKITYAKGVHFLFRYLYDVVDQKIPQPSRKGPKLGEMTIDQKRNVKRILEYSIRKSSDALQVEDLRTKIMRWEDIFGYVFKK